MAAVDSDVTPGTVGGAVVGRKKFEVIETIAITNQVAASTTINRALMVPTWANSFIALLDITITGTTPTMDFTISGGQAATRFGATLDSTTDKFEFTAGGPMTITQLTTAASTPIVAVSCGPGVQTDTTGSATVNSAYAFSAVTLPTWLIYTYITTDAADDADYNGTISFIWGK